MKVNFVFKCTFRHVVLKKPFSQSSVSILTTISIFLSTFILLRAGYSSIFKGKFSKERDGNNKHRIISLIFDINTQRGCMKWELIDIAILTLGIMNSSANAEVTISNNLTTWPAIVSYDIRTHRDIVILNKKKKTH